MAEEFDEALEAARSEWAAEHDLPDYQGDLSAAPTMMPGYRCIDLSQLSNHDLRVVDDLLRRYRSKRRPPQRRPLWVRR
ncbi:hypothetical protein ACFXO9_09695 [Nocardia tengchongensis]|uniref:hypothetical protein n=1 Tax=Nocardia tengchongensis TaxID=2055889 RepID=UPI0036C4FA1E